MGETRRRVILIEITTDKRFSSSDLENRLRAYMPTKYDLVVWGQISSVDAAYRKLRQLSRETERDAPQSDRVHSAHKAMSFFRDMFPTGFWDWKQIGKEHLRDSAGKLISIPGRSS